MRRDRESTYILRCGLLGLLSIKDTDMRIATIRQGADAVDRGIHIGGAFSALVPLVSLYYSGVMRFDVADPTRPGQDLFVLSKGHAVAALASIYADLGYFDPGLLANSRSFESILNGHPGPLLPGVHISTGPEGHGLPVAQGFALAGKQAPTFDVFCLTGDGELQAGMIWEAVQFAGARRLDNLCAIVDKNEGQLDNPRSLAFPMSGLEERFRSFGWRAVAVDGMGYEGMLGALEDFRFKRREGKPLAVICNSRKGWGGYSSFMVGHKVELPEALAEQELELHRQRRADRVADFFRTFASGLDEDRAALRACAERMNLRIDEAARTVQAARAPVETKPATPRDKRVAYDHGGLPRLEKGREYAAAAVITGAMKEFARGGRVVSVDADLATTSGLEAGVAWADMEKAFNVGVAESNMACIGEAFAVLGYNTWVSTFCPFFDWRVIRRIAIGYQERLEAIERGDWLSAGHNLDLVFLATAPDLETRTNGATHMGNDDALVFDQLAHMKIVHISCPNQLLAFMKWVMDGERGLVYARIPRAPVSVIYASDHVFVFGRATWLKRGNTACIVSSGRGVHESLAAAELLSGKGLLVSVVDMASWDEQCALELYDGGQPLFIAEQNNGWILRRLTETLWRNGRTILPGRITAINCLDRMGRPQYVHSATYEQLTDHFGLNAEKLAATIERTVQS
jgi:transketolase